MPMAKAPLNCELGVFEDDLIDVGEERQEVVFGDGCLAGVATLASHFVARAETGVLIAFEKSHALKNPEHIAVKILAQFANARYVGGFAEPLEAARGCRRHAFRYSIEFIEASLV